jgi:SAM-dependent methyltransferase
VADQYGESYFAHGLGEPYTRENPTWTAFFGRVADFIVEEFAPTTVLDAGCAIGFLVEALRERGVDARGFDISEYAISQVPEELKPYCTLGSVTDEIEGTYDLITCIEVLEHVQPGVAEQAIENFAGHTDRILFSSTPDDDREATHVNVKRPEEWVVDFAERGFLPRPSLTTLALSPQAIVFERRELLTSEVTGAYEAVRYRLARDLEQAKRAAVEERAAADARAVELERKLAAERQERMRLVIRAEAAEASAAELRASAAELGEAIAELRSTTWWRVGRPIRGLVTFVKLRAPAPTPRIAAASSRGTLVRLIKPLVPLGARRALREWFPETPRPPRAMTSQTAADLAATAFPQLRTLALFPVPPDGRRHLTLVTDSLGSGSLFGGVGTSMILATMLARRLGASLRVVTRTEQPEPSSFGTVLRAHSIVWDKNVEFSYAPRDGGGSIPYREDEIFLTTSWWSTWAALRSLDPRKIVYLLQEDERLFYPSGDERIACSEVLADPRIRFAVNTALLRDYLVDEGFENIRENGVAFEPAFPESIYFRQTRPPDTRKRFFFYARPDNARNLFIRGLEAVTDALAQGVMPPNEWQLHFVGSRVPSVELPGGIKPAIAQNLPWPEYAALIRSVDVGLSLVATPHPSYPPLDVAACGGIAVTNRFGPKHSLDRYSRNIICSELSREGLVDGIAQAVELAADEPRRLENYREQRLLRSWEAALEPMIDELTSGR